MNTHQRFMNPCQLICLLFLLLTTQTTSTEGLSPAEVLKQCLIYRLSKCYALFDEQPLKYEPANTTCHQHGGKLASIPDEDTQNFISSKFVNKENEVRCGKHFNHYVDCNIWFARFTKVGHSKDYFTDDGTPITYTNWQVNEPNIASRGGTGSTNYPMCGAFNAFDGLWYDDFCTYDRNYFLCEAESTACYNKDVQILKASFDSCFEDKMIPTGTKVNVQCNDGYELVGNEEIECRANGTWSDFPSCQRINPSPLSASSKSIIQESNAGRRNAVVLDPEYVLETNQTISHFLITCRDKADWEHSSKCEPINKFQVVTIGVTKDADVTVHCRFRNESLVHKNWLWQKNSVAVNGQDGYTTHSNGTLHIRNFQQSHVGVHSCFALSPRLSAGLVSYNLKLQSTCMDVSGSTKQHVLETKPLIMNCPHAGIEEAAKSFRWIKDGEPLMQSERLFVIPDGSLVIPNVIFTDRGQYSCEVSWNSGMCKSRLSIELIVEASAETVCGNVSLISVSPWTVALYLEDDQAPFCYGALIDNEWVVTSAYCMYPYIRKRRFEILVRFGKILPDAREPFRNSHTMTLTTTTDTDDTRYVNSIKIHPNYSPRLYANDVALVKLRNRISFNDEIQPICLKDKDMSEPDQCDPNRIVQGVVSGWGYLDVDNVQDLKFQTENMTVVDSELCQITAAAPAVKFTDTIFCATQNTSEIDSNAGNVGSPFVVDYEDRVYLVGTYIFGERHSRLGNYDYFTKIPKYVSWIRTIIS